MNYKATCKKLRNLKTNNKLKFKKIKIVVMEYVDGGRRIGHQLGLTVAKFIKYMKNSFHQINLIPLLVTVLKAMLEVKVMGSPVNRSQLMERFYGPKKMN